jgi:hypothetical protein
MSEIIPSPPGASQRRIEANRKNARASTGPRTPEGKNATGQNAVVHGLTARAILLGREDPQEFQRLRADILAEIGPRGALEGEVADQIVETLWRLRRVPSFERALFAALEEKTRKDTLFADALSRAAVALAPEQARDIGFGRVIERFLSGNFSGRLGRYETGLQRRLSRLLEDLRALKRQAENEAEG